MGGDRLRPKVGSPRARGGATGESHHAGVPVRTLSRKFPGRVQAYRRADLSFKVSGRLKELPAEEGALVKKGQLLAKLDPRDFETQVQSARAQLAKAKAALQLARTEYQRVLNIQKSEGIPDHEYRRNTNHADIRV
jgi:multidrug efflux pump subunit AcrA (membrane-fusion protein)